jgi:replicative DNA helicase
MTERNKPYKKKTTVNISTIGTELGKIPPQALDLEEAVLGAAMLEKDVVIEVLDILRPESFYKEAHQHIFAAIMALSQRMEPIDLLTVTEELKRSEHLEEAGGAAHLAQLTLRIGSAANIDFHAKIIAQKFLQRELIRISSKIQHDAFDEVTDVEELLNEAQGDILSLAEGNIKRQAQSLGEIAGVVFHQIEEARTRKESFSGVPSGFNELDNLTLGWQKSDLIVIAARPAMGKTAFVLSMARNMVIDHKRPVAFFSLEMASEQLVTRLFMSESQLSGKKLKSGKLTDDEMKQLSIGIQPLLEAPLYIDDTPSLSIFEFRSKVRRLYSLHKIQCVVIDYLQLMSGPPETKGFREQEVSAISRSLKAIAKELNIPIIALSQLNRGVETRSGSNKRPQLSDLRESGAIEQDADIVAFIHRHEAYQIFEDEQGRDTRGIGDIIIAKHRNGAVGEVRLRFIAEYAKFENLGEESLSEIIPSPTLRASKMNADSIPENTGFDVTDNNNIDNAPF